MPTPVPVPQADPYAGAPSVDYYDDSPAPPSDPNRYAQNTGPTVTQTASQRSFSATQLLPLGINLYLDDQILAGSIALAAQVATLGLWYMAFDEEQTTYENAKATIEDASQDPSFTNEDIEKFRQISDEYITQKQNEQIIYLSLFGVSWITSTVYAYFTSAKPLPVRTRRAPASYYGNLQLKPSRSVIHTRAMKSYSLEPFMNESGGLGLNFEMSF